MEVPMKLTKLQKLVAVYERFGAEIEAIPDPWAQKLHRNSVDTGSWVAGLLDKDSAPRPSEIASGLEQGLREMPDIIAAVGAQCRPAVAKAFNSAISTEYPEFQSRDEKRLDKVLTRGKIRTESEFYLVRYRVDALEGDPQFEALLRKLYGLLGAYELRA